MKVFPDIWFIQLYDIKFREIITPFTFYNWFLLFLLEFKFILELKDHALDSINIQPNSKILSRFELFHEHIFTRLHIYRFLNVNCLQIVYFTKCRIKEPLEFFVFFEILQFFQIIILM